MIYKFNKETLTFNNITGRVTLITLIITLIATLTLSTIVIYTYGSINNVVSVTKEIILKREREFSQDKLEAYINQLNLKYPHIVIAQAKLESGHFTSSIFKENNNLFGMKEAKQRPTTAKGTQNGHAYYNSWEESVQDYALYSAVYLNKLDSEEEYLIYLKEHYAENPDYLKQLKIIIAENN